MTVRIRITGILYAIPNMFLTIIINDLNYGIKLKIEKDVDNLKEEHTISKVESQIKIKEFKLNM